MGKKCLCENSVENSKGVFMGKVIEQLSNNNIKMNITALYTHKQTKEY